MEQGRAGIRAVTDSVRGKDATSKGARVSNLTSTDRIGRAVCHVERSAAESKTSLGDAVRSTRHSSESWNPGVAAGHAAVGGTCHAERSRSISWSVRSAQRSESCTSGTYDSVDSFQPSFLNQF